MCIYINTSKSHGLGFVDCLSRSKRELFRVMEILRLKRECDYVDEYICQNSLNCTF